MLEAIGIRTQTELAEALGIRQSSISDAKRRMVIPDSWLLRLLLQYRVNPLWILTGGYCRLLDPRETLEPVGG